MNKYILKIRQALPLKEKKMLTEKRIHQWVKEFGKNGCYVSFSGGKDSTVLLDIVRGLYPEITAVFVDTGLEYPEIRQFVKTFDNVTILRPKKSFKEVINDYGYPIGSKLISRRIADARKGCKYAIDMLNGQYNGGKSLYNIPQWKFLLNAPFKISHKCCDIMKKKPAYDYHKKTGKVPFIATMADESMLREVKYLQSGCNGFNLKTPTSTPMAFWTEQDVLQYLYETKIPYASVYGEIKVDEKGKYYTTGCQRTGCMFCGFGCHLEKYPNRFQRLAKTHPKQYDYIINKLGFGEVLQYIGVEYKPNVDNKGQMKIF